MEAMSGMHEQKNHPKSACIEVFIHAASHVSDKACIGSGTKIWINSQVRENARIGEECIIGKDTYIDTEVSIGNRVKVQNGVSIYKGVTIEDDVFIGPNAIFTNDLNPRAFNKDWKITPTKVCKGASIGANATIVCGVTLGEYCFVGAGSVVTKDVPAYALVYGGPARQHGWVCKCGVKLDEMLFCPVCGKKYRKINDHIEEIV